MVGDHFDYLASFLPGYFRFLCFRPNLLKHHRFIFQKANLVFPFSASLGVEVSRLMVVRPKPQLHPGYGKTFENCHSARPHHIPWLDRLQWVVHKICLMYFWGIEFSPSRWIRVAAASPLPGAGMKAKAKRGGRSRRRLASL
jgi:hypothetical protein